MREALTNIVMIALAVAFLAHFALIIIYGGYFIREPNLAILISETTFLVVVIGFGLFNLVKLLKRR